MRRGLLFGLGAAIGMVAGAVFALRVVEALDRAGLKWPTKA